MDIQLKDPKSIGLWARITRWIAQVSGGHLIPTSDLRWLVGEARMQQYHAAVKAARAEHKRQSKAKATDGINEGEVQTYLKDLNDALAKAKNLPSQFHGRGKPGSKSRSKAYDNWKNRREAARRAAEKLEETWSIVDPKHHDRFRHPRPTSHPDGPGWDHSEGARIAEMEWPPHLPKSELDYLQQPDVINVPYHQQRELLNDALWELQKPPEPADTEALADRLARLRARTAD